MKSEFTLAFNEIADRSKLKRDVILEAVESALVSAYRRSVNASTAQQVTASVDPETGSIKVFAEKEVVEDVQDIRTEVALADARQVAPDASLGDMVIVESTPREFGRIAAQTAKQVIQQRIREAERDAQYLEYAEREGEIVNGTVQSVTSQAVTIALGRAEASLPRNQQVAGERHRPHDKIRVFVLEVRKTSRGPQIIVSRSHKSMLRRLLEYEVPEIYNGLVEIKSIAREAGRRSKVAVAAQQEGVDPVGACVGMRGVRIQSIVRELNDEKIDIIEWNPDQATFISKALSPARVSGVYLNDDPVEGRTALVVVPDDQLSLAIGREGQNARLAAKLTGWRIDIKSLTEAAADTLRRLREDPNFAEMAADLSNEILQADSALTRRAENRLVAPEEYALLAKLVERVERAELARREAGREKRLRRLAEVRASIPKPAFSFPLAEAGLSERVYNLLAEAGFQKVGQVLEQLAMDEDAILALPQFGPKALDEVKTILGGLKYPEPEVPAVEAAPAAKAEVVAAPIAGAEAAPVEAQAPLAEAPIAIGVPVEAAAGEELPVPAQPEGGEAGEPVSLESLLTAVPVAREEEEEDTTSADWKKKKKKKGKRKQVVMEYDPDLGVMVARRKHKRGQGEWGADE